MCRFWPENALYQMFSVDDVQLGDDVVHSITVKYVAHVERNL